MIKTLIFDLGGVLVPFDFKRGYAAMERLCGYPAAEIPKRIGESGLVPRFESGQIEPRDFVAALTKAVGLTLTYEQFCDLWTCIFLPQTLIPEELIEALGRRYPLVLLSNTNAIHFEMLDAAYPILRHFQNRVLSYKVGAMKPSPAIYQAAIEKAGCEPHECFFTDDVIPYVEGAKQAGIDAVQFRTAEQLEHDLRARGIDW